MFATEFRVLPVCLGEPVSEKKLKRVLGSFPASPGSQLMPTLHTAVPVTMAIGEPFLLTLVVRQTNI
jgi:hypothetical protein